jgi:hypothetical protein
MIRRQAGVAVALVAFLTVCTSCMEAARVHQDFHESHPMQAGGHLRLGNTNGSVQVVGWDRDTIDISGTKYAESDEVLKEINVRTNVSGNTADIQTEIPSSFLHNQGAAVTYVIRLPHQTAIETVRTTNGRVSIENMTAGGRVESTNGQLAFDNDQGDFSGNTTNGGVQFRNCTGNERIGTTNGGVDVQLRAGSVDAHSTNGGVKVSVDQPSNGKQFRVATTNGAVTVALANVNANPVSVRTSNGGVTLRVPENANADLNLQTNHGGIKSDLNVTSDVQWSKHSLTGRLGRGGAPISAETSNGGITLQRY